MDKDKKTIPPNIFIPYIVEQLSNFFDGQILVDKLFGRNGTYEEDPYDLGYDVESTRKIHIGRSNSNVIRVNYLLAPEKEIKTKEQYIHTFTDIVNALDFESEYSEPRFFDNKKIRLGEIRMFQKLAEVVTPSQIVYPIDKDIFDEYTRALGRSPVISKQPTKEYLYVNHLIRLHTSKNHAEQAMNSEKEQLYDIVTDFKF